MTLKGKTLEWVRDPMLDSLKCVTEIGTYYCVRTAFDASKLYLDKELLGSWGGGSHEIAKAAAQSDYESRIISAIETTPAPVIEITDEMVEAKRQAIDLLLQADDIWEDYGSGFRVHFSFKSGAHMKVVERIHTARSLEAALNNKA